MIKKNLLTDLKVFPPVVQNNFETFFRVVFVKSKAEAVVRRFEVVAQSLHASREMLDLSSICGPEVILYSLFDDISKILVFFKAAEVADAN